MYKCMSRHPLVFSRTRDALSPLSYQNKPFFLALEEYQFQRKTSKNPVIKKHEISLQNQELGRSSLHELLWMKNGTLIRFSPRSQNFPPHTARSPCPYANVPCLYRQSSFILPPHFAPLRPISFFFFTFIVRASSSQRIVYFWSTFAFSFVRLHPSAFTLPLSNLSFSPLFHLSTFIFCTIFSAREHMHVFARFFFYRKFRTKGPTAINAANCKLTFFIFRSMHQLLWLPSTLAVIGIFDHFGTSNYSLLDQLVWVPPRLETLWIVSGAWRNDFACATVFNFALRKPNPKSGEE